MKLSALQLTRYVVTEVACKANPDYDPDKEWEGAFEGYSTNVKADQMLPESKDPEHEWMLLLEITQNNKQGKNLPYEFHLSILGTFILKVGELDKQKEARFVQVNGSSMLYGAAREQIRAITASGPWGEVSIPTMSFYENKEQQKAEDVSTGEKSGK